MNIPEWFQDPRMKDISPDKLTFLLNVAKPIEGQNPKQSMPVLMGAVASASRQNLQFTPEEFQLIFEIMKEGKSPEEKRKMDEMLKKARGVMKGKGQ